MKTKITVTRAGDAAPSEPEVDWEAFARTDGSACVDGGGELCERRGGRWHYFHDGRWIPCASNEREMAKYLSDGHRSPVHLDITWRPIK